MVPVYDDLNGIFAYWSNACGDLFNLDKDITKDELPEVLRWCYEELWSDADGSYCYLAEKNCRYGIALINEYHEYTAEGDPGEQNNFDRAVSVASDLDAYLAKYDAPYEVFIGKQTGFPGHCKEDPANQDQATELVLFFYADPTDHIDKKVYSEAVDWLSKNAYYSCCHDRRRKGIFMKDLKKHFRDDAEKIADFTLRCIPTSRRKSTMTQRMRFIRIIWHR